MTYDTVVIGGGSIGAALAGALSGDVGTVAFLGENDGAVERAAAAGADARFIEGSAPSALDREGIDAPEVAIAASTEDARNLLVAQLVRRRRAGRVIALVNDPENVEAFDDAGVEAVCASTALVSALDRKRRGEEVLETHESSEDRQRSTNGNERLRSGGGGDA